MDADAAPAAAAGSLEDAYAYRCFTGKKGSKRWQSALAQTQEFLRAYESEMWSMQVLALRGIRRGGARSLTRHPCSVCPPLPLQSLLAEREVVTMHNHAMSSGQTKGSSML